VVQIGGPDKLQKLVGDNSTGDVNKADITKCSLSPVVTIIRIGDSFGALESNKTTTTLISPVSGEIIEMNQDLLAYPAVIRISFDPYNNGWMLKIKMSKPEELAELL
jgi:glycine cleavage system H protein